MRTASSSWVLALPLACGLATCLGHPPERPQDQRDSMVPIHAATFPMGINRSEIRSYQKVFNIEHPQLFDDEVPRHSVMIGDFYLDKYLVTNDQFKRFLQANPLWQPGNIRREFDNGNYLVHWATRDARSAEPDHPVVNVNWYAATFYCRSEGKRLPTEAEWEYAARGGLPNVLFPWGNAAPDETRANFGDHIGTTTRVDAYPPNRYGLFDMAGNVWQFLYDQWAPYNAGTDRHHAERPAPREGVQPIPLPEARRVIRGGSFAGSPVNLWVEYRDSHPANGSSAHVGFRCARSVSPEPSSPP